MVAIEKGEQLREVIGLPVTIQVGFSHAKTSTTSNLRIEIAIADGQFSPLLNI